MRLIKLEKFAILAGLIVLIITLSGCTAECGDSICNRLLESGTTCPADCQLGAPSGGTNPPAGGGTGNQPPGAANLCANGIADAGENCTNCPADIMCVQGEICMDGACIAVPPGLPGAECGNGVVDEGETSESCCTDAGCAFNKDCVNNECVLKSCAQRQGIGCSSGEKCKGQIIKVSDSNNCCIGGCEGKDCAGRGGEICREGYACFESTFAASDSQLCCPLGKCRISTTCISGNSCELGCSGGDSDCNCQVQGGILCASGNKCSIGPIKSYESGICCTGECAPADCTAAVGETPSEGCENSCPQEANTPGACYCIDKSSAPVTVITSEQKLCLLNTGTGSGQWFGIGKEANCDFNSAAPAGGCICGSYFCQGNYCCDNVCSSAACINS